MPNSKAGRVAVSLLGGCAAIFAVAIVVSLIAGDGIDGTGFDVYKFVVGVGFLLTAVGSTVAGIIAIVRHRDRGLLVITAVALGLLAVAFALGDVVSP